jgi:hypothetical protein
MCGDRIETSKKMLCKKIHFAKDKIFREFSFHQNLKRHFRKKCKRQEKREAKERIGYKKKKKMERRKNWEKGHKKEKKGKGRRKISKERI